MRSLYRLTFGAVLVVLVLAAASVGRSQQADQPPAQQAADKTVTPAAKPVATKQPAKTVQKKPKKVWTNDDIPSAPDPDSPEAQLAKTARPEPTVGPVDKKEVIADFRKQLNKLRADLDATEKKLSELQNFKGNNTSASGGIDPRHGYSMTPVPDQIRQLEAKKKLILANIDDLQDQARKQGIEPGELR